MKTSRSAASSSGSTVTSQGFSRITEEDKFNAMLGKKDLNRAYVGTNEFFREEFCGACGIIHANPDLLDIYHSCRSCHCVMREPCVLRERFKNIPKSADLEILYATYGDPFDPELAVDVTEVLRGRMESLSHQDRLAIKKTERMDQLFGVDPVPGKNKQLRLRYRMNGIHGTMVLDFNPQNSIPTNFLIIAPKQRYLKIFSAIYGHPRGLNSTGRMSFDVLEMVQSLVDQHGGSYLRLSSYVPLARLFGDPCPGYAKDLRIKFEIRGRGGTVVHSEIRGFLTKKVCLQSAPKIGPLIFVLNATYGITPSGKKERLDFLDKQLLRVALIEHKTDQGMSVPPAEKKLLKMKAEWVRQRDIFKNLTANHIDVSYKLQKMADIGGHRIFLDKEDFDPNRVFGNPLPGVVKILECQLSCQGHDSENLTETKEMMDTGYSRNFITAKKHRFSIVVEDDESGKGKLAESLDFFTDMAAPNIIITRATYGDLNLCNDADMSCEALLYQSSKIIDVTGQIQNMVKGRSLIIERDVNLDRLFQKDPSPGKRKQLKISYLNRGFTGNLRIQEKNDLLMAGVELGYPPVPPPDDHVGSVF